MPRRKWRSAAVAAVLLLVLVNAVRQIAAVDDYKDLVIGSPEEKR